MHLIHLLSQIKNDENLEASVFCIGGGELEKKLRELKISVSTFEMENLWSIKDIWAMGKAIKALNPDLVHCHLNRAALYGSLFCKFLKIPVISTAHGLTKSIYYKFSNKIICVSEAVKKHFLISLSDRKSSLVTIHNGIPLTTKYNDNEVSKIRKKLNVTNKDRLVTVIGTFHKNKGQDIAIKAINEIHNSKNVHLLLTGAGPEEKNLHTLSKLLPLAGRIHLLPHQAELGNIYKASDVILVPSHKEALSLVTLEALLHETPVIASHTGGIPEIITNKEEGILVEPGNSKALAKAITDCIDNYRGSIAMAKDGHKKVLEQFSLKLCYQKTRELYFTQMNTDN